MLYQFCIDHCNGTFLVNSATVVWLKVDSNILADPVDGVWCIPWQLQHWQQAQGYDKKSSPFLTMCTYFNWAALGQHVVIYKKIDDESKSKK